MKVKALVTKSTKENVKWLTIESDENDTKGFFVCYFVDENNAFDTWHKTYDDALSAAYEQFGIDRNAWKSLVD